MVPSGNLLHFAIENGPVEIVSCPINSMVDLSIVMYSYVTVYQRVTPVFNTGFFKTHGDFQIWVCLKIG